MGEIRQHLRLSKVAELLDVSESTVEREIARGKLAVRFVGRQRRVDIAHLQVYLAERTRAGRGGKPKRARVTDEERAGSKNCTVPDSGAVENSCPASTCLNPLGFDAKRGATADGLTLHRVAPSLPGSTPSLVGADATPGDPRFPLSRSATIARRPYSETTATVTEAHYE